MHALWLEESPRRSVNHCSQFIFDREHTCDYGGEDNEERRQ